MNYKEAINYIEKLNQHGIVPGLDSIRTLCAGLGNPQEQLSFVHIAGTNGKGSTLAYLSTILQKAGYRVGRYLSPTLFDYRERFQVNQHRISQTLFTQLLEQVKQVCDGMVAEGMPEPTAFEVETALAFLFFKTKRCDLVVLETGLGGTLDATNLIQHTVAAVITSISLDHMGILGNTLTEIAENKAGIIKNGCYVISVKQQPEAEAVIEQTCLEKQTKLVIADPGKASHIKYGIKKQSFQYGGDKAYEITLAGVCQIDNAVLAIETIDVLRQAGFPVSQTQLRQGLFDTKWPGRFEPIAQNPLFIVDGAHNRDAALRLAESIRFYFTNKRIIYIMGILRDKEYEEIIKATYCYAAHIITVTPPHNKRALRAYDLAMELQQYHTSVTVADSLEEAVEISHLLAAKTDVILAFGSLSYLGELTRIVQNKA